MVPLDPLLDLFPGLVRGTGEDRAEALIRGLRDDVRPPLLDEHGLDGALRSLGSVAAEALHNVAKHARAGACVVRLASDPDALTLTIRDDGVGLPAHRGVGVGLASMRERAAELGGTLIVAAAAGGGTCVTATIPRRHAP